MVNSIQNSIQNFEISWIQFNKIFIQFENVGIDHGYYRTPLPPSSSQIPKTSRFLPGMNDGDSKSNEL